MPWPVCKKCNYNILGYDITENGVYYVENCNACLPANYKFVCDDPVFLEEVKRRRGDQIDKLKHIGFYEEKEDSIKNSKKIMVYYFLTKLENIYNSNPGKIDDPKNIEQVRSMGVFLDDNYGINGLNALYERLKSMFNVEFANFVLECWDCVET